MEEEVETTGPSLTINNNVPCFIMPDGSMKHTTAPELFDTTGGALGYADNYRTNLDALYDSVEERKQAARSAIDRFGLLDDENAEDYSIWLLVAMTLED
jgi:hypothetical protein